MNPAPRRRVVLQARTSSTRLPGKVLLPVAGLPIVVLAARRAARDGVEAVVATSDDASDDGLAEALRKHGIRHVRGPLADVLERYILATADLGEDDICVRLTCDNVFPDGDFVSRLIAGLESNATGYSGMQGGTDGLPFGLAGEAMRVRLLRQAARETRDPYDHEHVTPWIIRRCGRNAPVILPPPGIDLSGVRCTVDTLDDYRNVAAALAGLADPVAVAWQDLCRRLARWLERARPFVPARIVAGELQAGLVLGGAPFGMTHGAASPKGTVDDPELRAILDLAEGAGLSHIDTAAGYGDGEARIGSALTPDSPLAIITQLPPNVLDGQPSAGDASQRAHVAVDRSLWLLGRARLDAVLLHRFDQYAGSQGAIWQTLLALKAEGKIGRIGASVDRPEDLATLLENPDVGLVQLPFNVLDRRWLEPGIQRAIAARPDVILHGRSALQGLSTIDDPLKAMAAKLGRESVIDLCLAYARAQGWLAGIVVGAETAAQMAETIRLFQAPALSADEAKAVAAATMPIRP